MGRIYFKKPKKMDVKFNDYMEDLGATYVDDDGGVFVKEKQDGESRIGIMITKTGFVEFGKIEDDCENFVPLCETNCKSFFKAELEWFNKLSTKILQHKNLKLK